MLIWSVYKFRGMILMIIIFLSLKEEKYHIVNICD